VAQVVEQLPSKCEALSSKPKTEKKKKDCVEYSLLRDLLDRSMVLGNSKNQLDPHNLGHKGTDI
jgi:hypothetical protein